MGEFRMPSLGADMEAGTLVEWLVKPGDCVKRGDVIAMVEQSEDSLATVDVCLHGCQPFVEIGADQRSSRVKPVREDITAAARVKVDRARFIGVDTDRWRQGAKDRHGFGITDSPGVVLE